MLYRATSVNNIDGRSTILFVIDTSPWLYVFFMSFFRLTSVGPLFTAKGEVIYKSSRMTHLLHFFVFEDQNTL